MSWTDQVWVRPERRSISPCNLPAQRRLRRRRLLSRILPRAQRSSLSRMKLQDLAQPMHPKPPFVATLPATLMRPLLRSSLGRLMFPAQFWIWGLSGPRASPQRLLLPRLALLDWENRWERAAEPPGLRAPLSSH